MAKSKLNVQLEEIDTLIRARCPVLYLVTWEEKRIERALIGLGARRNKKVYTWSCTNGVLAAGTPLDLAKCRTSPTRDPQAALDHVMASSESALFLFQDFHPFLARNNFAAIRKLREAAHHLKDSYKTIVIVAPVLELPVELEKELAVIHLELPGVEETAALLDRILEEVKGNPNVRVALDAEARERMLRAASGLTLEETENVFAKALVSRGVLDSSDIEMVLAEKKQIIRKSGLLDFFESGEGFADVGGLDDLKDWLSKRSEAFSDAARRFGLPYPKGVLLLGVQGCGKSLSAKAAATQWRLPLLRFDIGRMFGSLVGSSEENMRRALQVAESVAPAILWVDEIDKAFAGVTRSGGSDAGTSARVFGTFLTWLSEKKSPVFVMATANDISQLPPELLRKGRLDEIFFVDLPNRRERVDIFRIHIARRRRDPEKFDIEQLADAAQGFSGAEIEEVVVSALFDAFAARKDLSGEFLAAAIAKTVPLSRTMQEDMEALRAWASERARRASPRDEDAGAVSGARRLEV